MYFNRFTQRAKTAIDLGVESAKSFGHKIVGTEHLLLGPAIDLGVESAKSFGHKIVGTEHLLLGLLKEKDGIAAKVLNKLGVTEDVLENKIIEIEKSFGHKIVGTEHLLLGLLKEKDGIAAKVLNKLGVTEDVLENKIIEIEGKNDTTTTEVTLSPRSKQILELSGAFANKLKTNYIGTEHILLSLAQEGEGLGMRILASLNIDSRDIAESIIDMMGIDNYSIEPKKVSKAR